MISLIDKVAVITGGARGIGRAVALRLAEAGADVVVSDKLIEAAEATVAEVLKFGRRSIAIAADVAKIDQAENLVEKAISEFGHIDIMVNNAGITRDNLIIRMDEQEWDAVISVNLKGTFNVIKAVTRPMMKQRSGKIINMASVVGIMGNAGQANYAASKAGVIGLTKSIAKELGSRNIQVNAIAPGYIETDMTKDLPQTAKDFFMANIPLKRSGKPQDVADTVLFLASAMSDYITGQVIHVDGGMVM